MAAEPTSSWVSVPEGSDFPIYNIPFGIFRPAPGATPRPATAIGEHALDLSVLAEAGLFPAEYADALKQKTLNDFMAAGRGAWKDARARIQALLASPEWPGAVATLRESAELQAKALVPLSSITMELPAAIGDYTDFYSSRDHAYNVGVMFRGPDNALQPNWLWLPVGYHGRSSSVVPSGTPIRRPCGQLQASATDPSAGAVYGECKQLDFELEVGTFVGPGNALGEPVKMADANAHIFGLCLMNDWSARDIQKWEYVPLGPFGAKNFGTTISPWVVTLEALEPFKCETSTGPAQTAPAPLAYLVDPEYGSYDVQLQVSLRSASMAAAGLPATTLTRSNFKYMYWNLRQQLVHHTVTGCNMRPGDLLGSGTISGPAPDSFGSMLELAWRGTKPIALPEGHGSRVFIADGDEVAITGFCEGVGADGVKRRIGFGGCSGVVLPAKPQ